MLNIEQRDKIINRYMKWICNYQLNHTPETFLEWLLINHYINEPRITAKDILNSMYGKTATEYANTDTIDDGMKYTE